MSFMEAHRYLKGFCIQPSVQRTAVMEYLKKHRTHPTVEEIFLALSPKIPTLSKTTVYNALNLFVEKGAIQMLTIDEKNARYDANITKHAHFYCRSCGKVHDIFNLEHETYKVPTFKDFKVDAVEISYFGTCKQCKGS